MSTPEERRRRVDEVKASLGAEGLAVSRDADLDIEDYISGLITSAELFERTMQRIYGATKDGS